MEHIEELPTIYGLEKNGKTKVWTARIYRDVLNGFATAEIEYGQLDGKKQTTSREYTEGKNLGKKNETTPLQQCLSETRRKWQDKMEKEGYSLVPPTSKSESNTTDTTDTTDTTNAIKVFPMLAHTYEPLSSKNKKNGIVFPCYVQPKLDGLRCICYMVPNGSSNESKVVAQSRTGAYFETMEHICEELRPILLKNPGLILDGELYTPDMPFEELAGLIKRKKTTDTNIKRIRYHIYDVVMHAASYSERHDRIVGTIPPADQCFYLEVVHTQLIHDLNAFQQAFSEYVASGYEGIMLRNVAGPYRPNYRSHDLQKYKEFVEAEYPIVGFKEADGRDKGTVVWVCATDECRQFSVRPRGTQEQRRQWFQAGHKYQGKLLTVIYQELSELNVPRFPVGKAIRDGY